MKALIFIFFPCVLWDLIVSGDNWAVIVSTSRYWHNYRHLTNALAVYRIVRDQGFANSRIIFMNAHDGAACDSRNEYIGNVVVPNRFNKDSKKYSSIYNMNNMEIDYRGLDVNVESFTRVMTGSYDTHTPISKRLDSDENSNIFLYLTGHGGDEFLKFHDNEEISSEDLMMMIDIMQQRKRFKQMFIVIDTCQAETLFQQIVPKYNNIMVLSSSLKGENSYAYKINTTIHVPTIDRFTLQMYEFFEKYKPSEIKDLTLYDLIHSFDISFLGSHTTLSGNNNDGIHQIKLSEFFGPGTRKSNWIDFNLHYIKD